MGTCLALAGFISNNTNFLKNQTTLLYSFGIVVLPMLLILLQPDAGSALVFLSFLFVLYRAGLNPNFFLLLFFFIAFTILGLISGLGTIVVLLMLLGTFLLIQNYKKLRYSLLIYFVILVAALIGLYRGFLVETLYVTGIVLSIAIGLQFYQKNFRQILSILSLLILGLLLSFTSQFVFNNVLEKHQKERINVWLQPHKCDPQGSLYNLLQSKMAIGSGGLKGKGFLQGTMTKFNYVPEQSTDFIFCTIGEEQGFIGSLMLIGLYLSLIIRIILVSERQRLNFSKLFGYGLSSILFFHMFTNIGMTMGLVFVIGIPLPFISYGGTSLLIFTIMIAIFLKTCQEVY